MKEATERSHYPCFIHSWVVRAYWLVLWLSETSNSGFLTFWRVLTDWSDYALRSRQFSIHNYLALILQPICLFTTLCGISLLDSFRMIVCYGMLYCLREIPHTAFGKSNAISELIEALKSPQTCDEGYVDRQQCLPTTSVLVRIGVSRVRLHIAQLLIVTDTSALFK